MLIKSSVYLSSNLSIKCSFTFYILLSIVYKEKQKKSDKRNGTVDVSWSEQIVEMAKVIFVAEMIDRIHKYVIWMGNSEHLNVRKILWTCTYKSKMDHFMSWNRHSRAKRTWAIQISRMDVLRWCYTLHTVCSAYSKVSRSSRQLVNRSPCTSLILYEWIISAVVEQGYPSCQI